MRKIPLIYKLIATPFVAVLMTLSLKGLFVLGGVNLGDIFIVILWFFMTFFGVVFQIISNEDN